MDGYDCRVGSFEENPLEVESVIAEEGHQIDPAINLFGGVDDGEIEFLKLRRYAVLEY